MLIDRLHLRFLLLLIVMFVALASPVTAQTDLPEFVDIRGHWAESFVRTLLYSGVVASGSDGRFRPDEPVTRLDFAAWVAAAMELTPAAEPAEAPFSDWDQIPAELQGRILAAVRAGLIQGYPDGSFRPSSPLTRAELGVIFGRALTAIGVEPETRFRSMFADAEHIPDWAFPALAAVRAQVIIGVPEGDRLLFAAERQTSRAQAATMIVRFIEKRVEILGIERPQPIHRLRPSGPVVTAYYMIDAFDSLQRYGHLLDWVFYASYRLASPDGTITGYDGPQTLRWAAQNDKPLVAMIAAHDRAINEAFLQDPEAQARFIAQAKALTERGYSGVHLDFEYVSAAQRHAFTDFVARIAREFQGAGLHISLAVPAKTRENLASDWVGAFDYQALGRLVDYVMLMTYDEHWRGGPPGPVGSLGWMRAVLDYATTQIPRERILLGVPAYGYDWPQGGGSGRSIRAREALELAARTRATVRYDPTVGEASFTYRDDQGVSRIVYFTPPQGLAAKLALVGEYGIAGAAMWRMGQEPEDYWSTWDDLF
ncbi:MAG TPA: S-layer homology domain-containing protein [Bacillota bacterium]